MSGSAKGTSSGSSSAGGGASSTVSGGGSASAGSSSPAADDGLSSQLAALAARLSTVEQQLGAYSALGGEQQLTVASLQGEVTALQNALAMLESELTGIDLGDLKSLARQTAWAVNTLVLKFPSELPPGAAALGPAKPAFPAPVTGVVPR